MSKTEPIAAALLSAAGCGIDRELHVLERAAQVVALVLLLLLAQPKLDGFDGVKRAWRG